MKQRTLISLFVFATFALIASVAVAALPVCSSSSPRGQVCASGTTVKTSCGNGTFLTGAVRNAGQIDDGCFALQSSVGPGGSAGTVKKAKKANSDARQLSP